MIYQKLINIFMKVMGQGMPEQPTIPHKQIQNLRWKLIQEENEELSTAAEANDIVEVADALCDLRYVVEGAFTAYGFSPELADELFREVQRSNMSKVCQTEQEALDTIEKYVNEGISTHSKEVNGLFVVSRLSDNKVLKSVNYSEPDLKSILERHGVKC
jgi:predicted HAD superfamily Cof-like phosphohydrolase